MIYDTGVKDELMDRGYSEKEADREVAVRTHNNDLTRAFMVVAVVGMGIALINTPVRLGQALDLGFWTEFVKSSDAVRYISNHVKGAGQAVIYSQIVNFALEQFLRERKEAGIRKEFGRHSTQVMEDHSLKVGTACMAGGYIWEKISQPMNRGGVFDTEDMVWYGVGVATLVAWNKTSAAWAKWKNPQAFETAPKPARPCTP
ncbi:MAG: hypothetical protein KGQ41_03315 [Alphaproteobacteria bacterium]|nr:hypothetical protein [Alphaproteobacteria bacterium]